MSRTTPEGKIKQRVVAVLRKHDLWYFFPPASAYGRAGVPDIIVCVRGRFVGIECKASPAHKPTALQLHCAADIMAAGGLWFLVYDDVTCASLDGALSGLGSS